MVQNHSRPTETLRLRDTPIKHYMPLFILQSLVIFFWSVDWSWRTDRMSSAKIWSYFLWVLFVGLGERGSLL